MKNAKLSKRDKMYKQLGFFKTSLLMSLYTTQILGLAFFMEAFIAILRKNAVSLENLGLIYMLGLFWIVRFLWAPLIDRLSISKTCHYKAWIGLFQLLLVGVLIALCMLDVKNDVNLIIALAFLYSFFSASQDIALDALVLRDISLDSRPFANSLKMSGHMLGTIIGGGLGLVIYDFFGWSATMFLLGVVTLNSLVQLYFYKEKTIYKPKLEKFKLKQ